MIWEQYQPFLTIFSSLISTAPDDTCPCRCGSALRSSETFQVLIFCIAHTRKSLSIDRTPTSMQWAAEQSPGTTWGISVFLPRRCVPGLHLLWQITSEGSGVALQITTLQWKYNYTKKSIAACTGESSKNWIRRTPNEIKWMLLYGKASLYVLLLRLCLEGR